MKENNEAKAAPVKGICYVEVNNYSIANVGDYQLTSGKQLFDIGIIFAANINYDTTNKKAYLYFNKNTQHVLDNAATLIKPLQAKGIKVLLSVLGNHQGAGISNFPDQAAADDFAKQLHSAVVKYGLDGIDFDDEYADYGTNGTGMPNDFSFVYLVTALRKLMPKKIISFYFIGPAAQHLSYKGVTVGSQVDYAWNPYYGTYSAPVVPGLSKADLSPAAINIVETSASTAASFATQTIKDGYGLYLYYNLTDVNAAKYLSNVSQVLYGEDTVYTTKENV